MDQKELGQAGERQAAQYLISKGYRVMERNYRNRLGEIDLIAFDPDRSEWVFTEVKTRSNSHFGYPEEAVRYSKMKKLERVALSWLKMKGETESNWRIDVISITRGTGQYDIRHLTHQSL